MAKQKAPGWAGFPEGAAFALALYILMQCLLALLTIKAVLPETASFRCQAVCGALAACFGGILAIRRTSVGTLWAALGSTAIFILLLLLGGMLACNGVIWSKKTIILLAAVLGGGILSGLCGNRRKGKKHKMPASGRREASVRKKPL